MNIASFKQFTLWIVLQNKEATKPGHVVLICHIALKFPTLLFVQMPLHVSLKFIFFCSCSILQQQCSNFTFLQIEYTKFPCVKKPASLQLLWMEEFKWTTFHSNFVYICFPFSSRWNVTFRIMNEPTKRTAKYKINNESIMQSIDAATRMFSTCTMCVCECVSVCHTGKIVIAKRSVKNNVYMIRTLQWISSTIWRLTIFTLGRSISVKKKDFWIKYFLIHSNKSSRCVECFNVHCLLADDDFFLALGHKTWIPNNFFVK